MTTKSSQAVAMAQFGYADRFRSCAAPRTTSSDSPTFSLQVWDYRGTSDTPLYTIQAHTRDIINMDVHENAFASGSLDDSLKMWLIG